MAITIHNSGALAGTTVAATEVVGPLIRISAAAERYIVAVIGYRSNTQALSSVNWRPGTTSGSNVPMTFLGKQVHSTSTLTLEYWGLLAPTVYTSTTARVTFTHPNAIAYSAWAVCLTGVDQTTPYAGYPGLATALNTAQATSTSTTTYTTAMAATTTTAGQLVVQGHAWAIVAGTETMVPSAGHEWIGSRIFNPQLQVGVQTITATGASTSSNAGFGNNTAPNPIPVVIGALPFNKSTTAAPYWVVPPQTAQSTAVVTQPLALISTTGFNSAANTPSIVYGAFAQQSAVNSTPPRYTAITATSTTSNSVGGSTNIGTRVQEMGAFGQAATPVATRPFVLPSVLLTDDIALVTVNTVVSGAQPTIAGFTAVSAGIQNAGSSGAAFRTDTFYRRIIAGDLVNEAARTFTITAAAGTPFIYCQTALYRGCVTSGSPVDATATTSGTALAAGATATAATVTTTGLNRLIATFFASNLLSATAREGPGAWTRRGSYYGLHFGDDAQAAAGVSTAAQDIPHPSTATDWTAITVALLPSGGSTIVRTAATTKTTRSLTGGRASSTYQRTAPRLTAARSLAAVRAAATFSRTAASVKTRSLAAVVVIIFNRTAAATRARSLTVSRAGSTYRRTAAKATTARALTVARSIITVAGSILNRTAATVKTRALAASRASSTYRRTAARTTALRILAAVRIATFRRTAARTTAARTLTVSRAGSTYRRTAIRTTTGRTLVVAYNLTTGTISFFDYGTPNEAVLQVLDPLHYPGFLFYWEASYRSSSPSGIAYCHLFDITAGAVVAGSQVATSVPHNVAQIVRSGAITLTSGHIYKARYGRSSGYFVLPGEARLVGESS